MFYESKLQAEKQKQTQTDRQTWHTHGEDNSVYRSDGTTVCTGLTEQQCVPV